MTRKLIIIVLILLILTIVVQAINSEVVEYSGDNPNDIYTSYDFNILSKSNNLDELTSFQDTQGNNILQEYMSLSYNDMLSKHNYYRNMLFNHYLNKEEDSINTMLSPTGDSNTKYVYLTKSNPSTNSYYNKAGEYMRNIEGNIYVWQPLSYWMLTDSEASLSSISNQDNNSPYIECWIREDMRSDSLNIPATIKENYKLSRPKETDILTYENGQYDFTYVSNNEIRTGNKVIRYIGKRKDNRERIFDERGPNMSSGKEAYNEIGNGSYNNYWNNNKYQNYVEKSVDYLNGNVKCFGLQWKAGELFYSENDDICNSIEDSPEHSHGWPHGWALNFYRIEEANDVIDNNVYTDNANLTYSEAEARRLSIRRSNNKVLILKEDLV